MQVLMGATPPTPDTAPTPVLMQFFIAAMLLVMFSLVATSLNLFMHHRNVNLQADMPNWLKTVLLHYLPKLCFMKYPRNSDNLHRREKKYHKQGGKEDVEPSENLSLFLHEEIDDVYKSHPSASDLVIFPVRKNTSTFLHENKQLVEILTELKKITADILYYSEEQTCLDDWRFAAMVLDRFCLYVFFIMLMIAIFSTIGWYPMVSFFTKCLARF